MYSNCNCNLIFVIFSGKKCEICKRKVKEQCLKINGDKFFHPDCFKCHGKYFYISFICSILYTVLLLYNCFFYYFFLLIVIFQFVILIFIISKMILACGVSLRDNGFYPTADGTYVCPAHYQRPTSPSGGQGGQAHNGRHHDQARPGSPTGKKTGRKGAGKE